MAEEFKQQFTYLGGNIQKYITFTVPIGKEVTRIDKDVEELQKIYLIYDNFLITQDLW